jgi:hypothetical protein
MLDGKGMNKKVWIGALVLGVLLGMGGGGLAIASSGRTVVVPRVHGLEISTAYARLHRAGLRVTITQGFENSLVHGNVLVPKQVQSMTPASGQLVKAGSIVTLILRCQCRRGTIRGKRRPAYRVPDFRRRRASVAYNWVRSKIVFLIAHLGPLQAGDAPTLFANYRINRQSPKPGTILRVSTPDGRTTPLTIWATQGRRS